MSTDKTESGVKADKEKHAYSMLSILASELDEVCNNNLHTSCCPFCTDHDALMTGVELDGEDCPFTRDDTYFCCEKCSEEHWIKYACGEYYAGYKKDKPEPITDVFKQVDRLAGVLAMACTYSWRDEGHCPWGWYIEKGQKLCILGKCVCGRANSEDWTKYADKIANSPFQLKE